MRAFEWRLSTRSNLTATMFFLVQMLSISSMRSNRTSPTYFCLISCWVPIMDLKRYRRFGATQNLPNCGLLSLAAEVPTRRSQPLFRLEQTIIL